MLFLFFSILGEWGGLVLESMENSILFFSTLPLDKIKSQSQNELETINNFKDFDDVSESPQKIVKIVKKRSNIPASGDQQRNDLVWATVGNGRVTVLPLSIGTKIK